MEVYRFNQRVAINPPEGPTFYLTAEDADRFWRAIQSATADIVGGTSFSRSILPPVEIRTTGDMLVQRETG